MEKETLVEIVRDALANSAANGYGVQDSKMSDRELAIDMYLKVDLPEDVTVEQLEEAVRAVRYPTN